jgi:hypothetical protein
MRIYIESTIPSYEQAGRALPVLCTPDEVIGELYE